MKVEAISRDLFDYQITLNEDEIRLLHDTVKGTDAGNIYRADWAAKELRDFLSKLHKKICHITMECF